MKMIGPERIFVEKDDRHRYMLLKQKLGNKFIHADIFVLAMIYGYMNGARCKLESKMGLFRTISARDNFYSVLILLYLNEKNEFPKNHEDFLEAGHIAQEYANGGLKFLEQDVYAEMENFPNKLSSIILKFNGEYDLF